MTTTDGFETPTGRRDWIRSLAGAALLTAVSPLTNLVRAFGGGANPPAKMTVYKSPSCGCCTNWVERARSAGFAMTVRDVPDVEPTKRRLKVPEALWSCHTALVGGYAIEGHVPLDLVSKLLREKPKAAGIAVPGMPAGSPGMEVGGMKDPYDVVLFESNGRTRIYARR